MLLLSMVCKTLIESRVLCRSGNRAKESLHPLTLLWTNKLVENTHSFDLRLSQSSICLYSTLQMQYVFILLIDLNFESDIGGVFIEMTHSQSTFFSRKITWRHFYLLSKMKFPFCNFQKRYFHRTLWNEVTKGSYDKKWFKLCCFLP